MENKKDPEVNMDFDHNSWLNPTLAGFNINQSQLPTPSHPNCARCNSNDTKFCFYNNYSIAQPRYYCKSCRRHWTHGGSLRNVPIGGGSRRNKRTRASSGPSFSSEVTPTNAAPPPPPAPIRDKGKGLMPNDIGTNNSLYPGEALLSALAAFDLIKQPYIAPPPPPPAAPIRDKGKGLMSNDIGANNSLFPGEALLSALAAFDSINKPHIGSSINSGRFGATMPVMQGTDFSAMNPQVPPLQFNTDYVPMQHDLLRTWDSRLGDKDGSTNALYGGGSTFWSDTMVDNAARPSNPSYYVDSVVQKHLGIGPSE